MRGKSNADIRLEYYHHLVDECILKYQNMSTGLIVNASAVDGDPLLLTKFENWKKTDYKNSTDSNLYSRATSAETIAPAHRNVKFHLPDINEDPVINSHVTEDNNRNHSWVRDNIYCIMSVWGLALAYRKISDIEEGKAKAYELEKTVVKTMRGLLCSMQMQTEKLEQFKYTQNPRDALHAKYNSINGKTVVGDYDWGHLQIDATSLFLLMLAQMTATGILIVFTLDEVAFIQNLVFYIEAAYRTPDYGIWERGDKTNHGLPELNSSSIGLAKAALESINGLDLFGSRGGPASLIHVMPDEMYQCETILNFMLPRESISKETDAALLTVIGFPAFAVDDLNLIAITLNNVKERLEGPYGCRRFLRDGFKTAREDPKRLHYEPWELMIFENIECQWPLFFAYLILDGLFNKKVEQVEIYRHKLEEVMLVSVNGIPVVPELYAVPEELVDEEYKKPNSQKRVAVGRIPHMWSQSMYILAQLMIEGLLSPGELDPLNRRHVAETSRHCGTSISHDVIMLCEDIFIQKKMADHGINLQTVAEAAPFQVLPGTALSKMYKMQGRNRQAKLTGRSSSSEVGLLGTSKLYILCDKILAFIPQVVDGKQFYLGLDVEYLINDFITKIDMLRCSWKEIGRPLIIYKLTRNALDNYQHPPSSLLATIKKLQSGFISGTRVNFGKLSDFQHTSCITQLHFLEDIFEQTGTKEKIVLDRIMTKPTMTSHLSLYSGANIRKFSNTVNSLGIPGIVQRSRSIQIQNDETMDLFVQSVPSGGKRLSRYSIVSNFTSRSDFGQIDNKQSRDGSIDLSTSPAELAQHLKTDNSAEINVRQTPALSTEQSGYQLSESDDYIDLVQQLKQSNNLQEQGDIVHYLFVQKGLYWNTEIDENVEVTVRDLLKELYEKAVTDLLVRQKQLSVGLPPDHEIIITSPLPPDDLATIIFQACGSNYSKASLTQELLVYLAMYIRTEPHLFEEMLRLRVGLIIQMMVTELSRSLDCSAEEASENLMSLSPYEVKTLLLHLLSGNELFLNDVEDIVVRNMADTFGEIYNKRLIMEMYSDLPLNVSRSDQLQIEEDISDRQGQWMRRRRLDGALNRVPIGFYPKVWELLRRCQSLIINGNTLTESLTREMTKQEFKFALQVDRVLNTIPQPDYRQLVVETMMVLTIIVENDGNQLDLSKIDIEVDRIVLEANKIFIKDVQMPPDVVVSTAAAAGICIYFYDIAPSGSCGSMSYMMRALPTIFNLPITSGELDCCVS